MVIKFDSSILVGNPVYIYTKVSPFIKNWKQIFLLMRKWLRKFCRPPLGQKKIFSNAGFIVFKTIGFVTR